MASFDANQKITHPTRTLYYPSLDKCSSLESDLQVQILIMDHFALMDKLSTRLIIRFINELNIFVPTFIL